MLNKKKGRKEGWRGEKRKKGRKKRGEREGEDGEEERRKKRKEENERKRVCVLTVLRMKSPVTSAIHLSALITFTLQLCPLLSNYM